MIPDHLNFNRLKALVSIEQILADLGVLARLEVRGNKLVGPCPIHRGDNTNAFVVTRSKNLWHCFTRCAQGGDSVDLVRRLTGMSFHNTAKYLASLANSAPHLVEFRVTRPKPPPPRTFRPFRRRLQLDPTAPFLARKRITPATAARFEAGAYQGPGFLHQCIGVRLHDLQGRPLGYAGRRLQPQQAKTLGKWKLPQSIPISNTLYNFHRLRRGEHRALVIVEGPWGVMRCAQLGIPAAALLGIHLSNTRIRILANLPRIILMLDGDRSGRTAMIAIKQRLQQHSHVRTVSLPDGSDPDDLSDHELLSVLSPLLL